MTKKEPTLEEEFKKLLCKNGDTLNYCLREDHMCQCIAKPSVILAFIKKVQQKERERAVRIVSEHFEPTIQEIADAIGSVAKKNAVQDIMIQLKTLSLEAIKQIKND